MFPDTARKQHGFLIPLALILLVGISFLAIAVNRLSAQSGSSATLEGLSAQAFYAAESGGQRGMHLLFLNATNRGQTTSNCVTLNGSSHDFNGVTGLNLCSVDITCTATTIATTTYYTVTSAATCGAGDFLAERTIQISSYMQ